MVDSRNLLEKSFPSTNEESYFKESKKQLEKLQLQLVEREMTPVFCMHELESSSPFTFVDQQLMSSETPHI